MGSDTRETTRGQLRLSCRDRVADQWEDRTSSWTQGPAPPLLQALSVSLRRRALWVTGQAISGPNVLKCYKGSE